MNYRDAFVDMYFDLKSKVEGRLAPTCDTSKEVEENSTAIGSGQLTHKSNYIKLKPIEIPIFNRSFEDWSAF